MHGVIFAELRSYAETKHGNGTWDALLERAGLTGRTYLPIKDYSDADAIALVGAASALTGLRVASVLEDFGEFIVPDLIKMYGHLLKPEWNTIDVIDNTEQTVHSVVRIKNPGAKPPQLQTVRRSTDEVSLNYSSPRKMCALAVGIGRAWQNTFEKKSRLPKPRACITARRSARLCSARNERHILTQDLPS
jgi:Haem-NO-binding